jgi:hypothetical protein
MSSIGRTTSEALRLAGWVETPEVPEEAFQRMSAEAPPAMKFHDFMHTQVAELYFVFHHPESDRYLNPALPARAFFVPAIP